MAVVVAVVSLAVVLVATPVCMKLALRTGVVDRPGPLKPQTKPVPYLGGAAVLLALVLGAVRARPWVLLPLLLAFGIGVVDDVVEIPPWTRLVGQILVGVCVASVVSTRLPAGVSVPLVCAVTVVLINGTNMLDGLDALAPGVVLAGAAAFAVLRAGGWRDFSIALVSGLVGFLAYNRPPARVYLGDGGSYVLGTALSVLLSASWAHGLRLSTSLAALMVCALPVAELAFTVIRRFRAGGELVSGDRSHSYDRIVARGTSVVKTSASYFAAELVIGAVAIGVSASRSAWLAVGVVVAVGLLLLATGAASGLLVPETGPK